MFSMQTDIGTQKQETKQKVFISYSRKDINFARRLAGDLEKAGFDVWWDISDLKGGDDWVRNIPTAIETSQFFIVLLSPDSAQSEWVTKEYTYAIYKRLKIVPAMIKPCNVPFALNTLNYVNFISDDYETGLKNLLTPLGGIFPPDMQLSWTEKLAKKLPPVVTKYPAVGIGIVILLLASIVFLFRQPVSPPTTPTPSQTSTLTVAAPTNIPTDPATDTPTPTPSQTFTPTITYTPTITRTKTPIPVNFILPTVCVQPAGDIFAVNVRTGPGTNNAVLPEVLPMSVGKCPYIGGHNEEDTWFMIAYNQPDEEFQPYEGGWIRKDLFDLSTPVFVPEITLTPTPTITPTFTVTSTPTPTRTPTNTPSPTSTHTPTFTPTTTDTPTPTRTEIPTTEPESTVTP